MPERLRALIVEAHFFATGERLTSTADLVNVPIPKVGAMWHNDVVWYLEDAICTVRKELATNTAEKAEKARRAAAAAKGEVVQKPAKKPRTDEAGKSSPAPPGTAVFVGSKYLAPSTAVSTSPAVSVSASLPGISPSRATSSRARRS